MFLHFHKLTTELFNSIKTQQINVFNASVDSNANCLCHTLRAIKSAGLQSTILLHRGLCVAGQWFLWLRQPLKLLRKRRYCTCLHAVFSSACQWMSNNMLNLNRTLQFMTKDVPSRRDQSQERSLTDFCGSYCDVVPHVRLSVQRFGQCDLPVVHVDVELPLQVCVSINEVPAKVTGNVSQNSETQWWHCWSTVCSPCCAAANRVLSIKRNL